MWHKKSKQKITAMFELRIRLVDCSNPAVPSLSTILKVHTLYIYLMCSCVVWDIYYIYKKTVLQCMFKLLRNGWIDFNELCFLSGSFENKWLSIFTSIGDYDINIPSKRFFYRYYVKPHNIKFSILRKKIFTRINFTIKKRLTSQLVKI